MDETRCARFITNQFRTFIKMLLKSGQSLPFISSLCSSYEFIKVLNQRMIRLYRMLMTIKARIVSAGIFTPSASTSGKRIFNLQHSRVDQVVWDFPFDNSSDFLSDRFSTFFFRFFRVPGDVRGYDYVIQSQ